MAIALTPLSPSVWVVYGLACGDPGNTFAPPIGANYPTLVEPPKPSLPPKAFKPVIPDNFDGHPVPNYLRKYLCRA